VTDLRESVCPTHGEIGHLAYQVILALQVVSTSDDAVAAMPRPWPDAARSAREPCRLAPSSLPGCGTVHELETNAVRVKEVDRLTTEADALSASMRTASRID
jgi:hypothetical protein